MERAVNIAESAMVAVHGLDFDDVKGMYEDLTKGAVDPKKHISIAVERFYNSVSLGGSKDLVQKVLNREHFLLSITYSDNMRGTSLVVLAQRFIRM